MLIKLTQPMAHWGTAPLRYRIFDVDDLMTNTTGTVLGSIAGALFPAALTLLVQVKTARRERVDLTQTR